MKAINIILVDDDDDDYHFFKDVLALNTYKTTFQRVENGEFLLDRLEEEKKELPDIVFLDMKLPGKSGLEILKILKTDERYKSIVVAIYSTSYMESIARQLYDVGADFYIRKPIRFEEMQRVIESTLEKISNENVKYLRSEESYLIT